MPVGAPPPRGAVHMSGLMPAATAVSTPAHMVGSPASVAATSPIMAPGATIMTGPSTVIQAPAPPVNMMVNPATSGPMEVMQPPPPIMDSISPVVSAAERPYPAAIPYVQAHPYYRYPQTQVPMYAHQYTQPMMQTTRGRQPFHHGATHAQMQQPLQHHQQQPRSNTPSPHAAYTGHTAASPAGSVRTSSPPPTYDWDPRVRSVLNQLTAGQVTHLLKSLNSGTGAESQGGQAYGTSPYNYPPYPVGPSSSSITHPVGTGAYGYEHYPFPPGYVSPLGAAGGLQQPYLHGQHMGSSSIASALGGPSTPATSSAPSASSGSGGGTAIPGIPGSENLIPMEDDDPDDDEHTRMWRVATDIDKDVNALNTSINQLIETFGLDPEMIVEEDQSFRFSSPLRVPPPPSSSSELASALSSNTAGPAMHPVGPGPGGDGGGGGGQQGDFDLHSFLSTLPSTNAATHAAEYGDIAAAASEFLDGVVSGTTSPILPATAIPSALSGMSGVGGGRMPEVQSRAGRKRKSDAVLGSDMEGVQSTGGLPAPSATVTRAANKTKRRKDK
ncbi:hypothetical protein BDQ17DRAFT_616535 [Cyathus striatus]|nr:hypothetical protein BDQ17DRAFT_616535 [Cyathus striatus]